MQGINFKNCSLDNHNMFQSSIICISEYCTSQNRICCIKCVKELHHDHVPQCILMDELLEGKIEQIPQASSELRNKMDALEQLTQDNGLVADSQFDNQYQDFQINLFKSVEIQRLQLRNKFKQKQEVFGDLINTLIHEYEKQFSITPIKQALDDFLSDKTNLQDFNKILKIYINDPDRTQQRSILLSLYKNCQEKLPNVDQNEIQYLKQKIKEEFENTLLLVRIPGNWFFISPQISQYNTMTKVQNGGTLVEFSNLESQQYVYGSHPLKSPITYQWTYKLDDTSGLNYNTVYIGVVLDACKEDLNQMFGCGKCVYLDIINNSLTQHLTLKSGKKQMSAVIKENTLKKIPTLIHFIFETKKGCLIIQDSEENSKYEYSKTLLKKSSQSSQSLQNQTKNHLEFFKSTNSYRPFIMNYSGVFKCEIV